MHFTTSVSLNFITRFIAGLLTNNRKHNLYIEDYHSGIDSKLKYVFHILFSLNIF